MLTTLHIIYNEIKWIKEEQMNLSKEKTHKNVYVNQMLVSSSETTEWNYFFQRFYFIFSLFWSFHGSIFDGNFYKTNKTQTFNTLWDR